MVPAADRISEQPEPTARELLDQYIHAFENADAAALERLLRRDAVLELPPSTIWYAGGDAIATTVAGLRGANATYRAYAIVVLTASTTGIARIAVFGDPGLFTPFGLPQTLPPQGLSSRDVSRTPSARSFGERPGPVAYGHRIAVPPDGSINPGLVRSGRRRL